METMSVKQLCNCLEKCGMPTFAQICRQECLDGRFLLTLTDESLRKAPFSLSEWDITKLQVKLGWTPRDSLPV
ncbi:hypothetical protein BaRGS_00018415 [Batillaria attramentaria]|uniref:SAM domain-containing protein n=1 Tax=Batillaria attramentaria TaxID=370345 RepID=A0ABD0KT32_9CAEN